MTLLDRCLLTVSPMLQVLSRSNGWTISQVIQISTIKSTTNSTRNLYTHTATDLTRYTKPTRRITRTPSRTSSTSLHKMLVSSSHSSCTNQSFLMPWICQTSSMKSRPHHSLSSTLSSNVNKQLSHLTSLSWSRLVLP